MKIKHNFFLTESETGIRLQASIANAINDIQKDLEYSAEFADSILTKKDFDEAEERWNNGLCFMPDPNWEMEFDALIQSGIKDRIPAYYAAKYTMYFDGLFQDSMEYDTTIAMSCGFLGIANPVVTYEKEYDTDLPMYVIDDAETKQYIADKVLAVKAKAKEIYSECEKIRLRDILNSGDVTETRNNIISALNVKNFIRILAYLYNDFQADYSERM